MISMISPAKNMKTVEYGEHMLSTPQFLGKTERVIKELKKYQPWELESMMKINEKLAMQAYVDICNFDLDADWKQNATAALLAYDGLVFKNISADTFSAEDMEYANRHLRILSACYGCERPLDGILPYRLEMQCKMKIDGQNLYQFWGDDIFQSLYEADDVVLNLASEEYAKTVRRYVQHERFVDVEFLTYHKGKLRTLATWAKMARGQMVRYIVQNRIDSPEGIQAFDWNGYEFEESLSNEKKYVFVLK